MRGQGAKVRPGGISRSEVRDLFNRNKKAREIAARSPSSKKPTDSGAATHATDADDPPKPGKPGGPHEQINVRNQRGGAVPRGVGDPLLRTLIGGNPISKLGRVVWGRSNNEVGGGRVLAMELASAIAAAA